MKKLIGILSFAVLACGPSILTPKTGPGTDYPCGLQGLSCGGGMCCWQGDVCGGGPFNGCPKDYCCPDNSDFYNNKPGVKKREQYPQMADYDLLNHKIVKDD